MFDTNHVQGVNKQSQHVWLCYL